MKFKNLKTLLLVFASICLFACSDDDNNGGGGTINTNSIKAIVGCEGGMDAGGSAIEAQLDLIYEDLSMQKNAFEVVNGRPLGAIAQSITEIDDKLFITLSNSAKIEVVNKADLKSIATIADKDKRMATPQYIVDLGNDRAVVSELYSNHLVIIDTKKYEVIATVSTKDHVKEMLKVGDKLFAAENDRIEVFTVTKGTLSSTSQVLDHPVTSNARLIHGKDNNVWALCCKYEQAKNEYITIKVQEGTEPYLVAINPADLSVKKTIKLGKLYPQRLSAKLESNFDGSDLYLPLWKNPVFKVNPGSWGDWMSVDGELGIYKISINDTEAPSSPLFTTKDVATSFYSLAITPENTIYICDANDYKQAGTIHEYNNTGTKIREFKTGVNPQYIFFYQ